MRRDGSKKEGLIVKVFADEEPSSFTLYEDNGKDISYASGEVRTTQLSQQQKNNKIKVSIAAASGGYVGEVKKRTNTVKLVTKNQFIKSVSLNGWKLKRYYDKASFDAAKRRWFHAGDNLFYAKSSRLHVGRDKNFVFESL